MSPRLSRISVLEQIPLFEGGDVRRTLGDLVRLGRGLEESGYHRLWLAEHHSTGSFLSSAPDLLMTGAAGGAVGAVTGDVAGSREGALARSCALMDPSHHEGSSGVRRVSPSVACVVAGAAALGGPGPR